MILTLGSSCMRNKGRGFICYKLSCFFLFIFKKEKKVSMWCVYKWININRELKIHISSHTTQEILDAKVTNCVQISGNVTFSSNFFFLTFFHKIRLIDYF